MKAVEFVDKDIKFVELPRGTYEVDGNIVECKDYNNKVYVVDIDSVRPITRTSVVCYYTTNGEDRYEKDWYESQKSDLLKKRTVIDLGDYETETKWESLEDEFSYRKFIYTYTAVNKNIEVIGDPIKFDVTSTVMDSGNPFIKSEFINGKENVSLFVYDRHSALLFIVKNCFDDLGMSFQNEVGYQQTKNQKIWGNSTHSCIEYVTAFGGYLFTNTHKNIVTIMRGSLEQMRSKYEEDKRTIEGIIRTRYNEHFGEIDKGNFNFKELINTLRTTQKRISDIKPSKSSYNDHSTALRLIREAITQIESSFKV